MIRKMWMVHDQLGSLDKMVLFIFSYLIQMKVSVSIIKFMQNVYVCVIILKRN